MNAPEPKEWFKENKGKTINDYYRIFGNRVNIVDYKREEIRIRKGNSNTWIYSILFIIALIVIIAFIYKKQTERPNIVDSPAKSFKNQKELFTNNLAGHAYLTTNNNSIYALEFIESDEVKVYILNIGIFQQPYSINDSIIDIELWAGPLQYKILNGHQLLLVESPNSYSQKDIMELRK